MARVITLARQYLQGHPKAGKPTFFVSSVWNSMYYDDAPHEVRCNPAFAEDWIKWLDDDCEYKKHHTIRFGRRWKTGDKASLRVWSGIPYRSPQIAITPDVILKVSNIEVDYDKGSIYSLDWLGIEICTLDINDPDLQFLSANDGLSPQDFLDWFQVGKKKGVHEAQILIWGDVKEY